MDLSNEDVHTLVTDIWSAMIGLEVTPVAPRPVEGPTLSGFVHINGDWQGTVTLECPSELAADAAAAMFGMDVTELTTEEIADALGELTNMTGGGIKALVPGTAQLSLPTVVEGLGHRVSVPGAELLTEVCFATGSHTVAVHVLQRQHAAKVGGAPSAAPTHA